MSEASKALGNITVAYKRTALNPDGSLGELSICDGSTTIYMTPAQAMALRNVIALKIPSPPTK